MFVFDLLQSKLQLQQLNIVFFFQLKNLYFMCMCRSIFNFYFLKNVNRLTYNST